MIPRKRKPADSELSPLDTHVALKKKKNKPFLDTLSLGFGSQLELPF
jgi:hypothetical protein